VRLPCVGRLRILLPAGPWPWAAFTTVAAATTAATAATSVAAALTLVRFAVIRALHWLSLRDHLHRPMSEVLPVVI
jgi:hypothetical protein